MKSVNWTYLDQMDFESELIDAEAGVAYFKFGSNLYILDSKYGNAKEEDEDEICYPFF